MRFLMILLLSSEACLAELHSINEDDLESFSAKSALNISSEKHTEVVNLKLELSIKRIDSDVLVSNGNKITNRDCKISGWKREKGTFGECWNNQAKNFYSNTDSFQKDGELLVSKLRITFSLYASGEISDIHVFGLESNEDLVSLFVAPLKNMRFGMVPDSKPIEMELAMGISKLNKTFEENKLVNKVVKKKFKFISVNH